MAAMQGFKGIRACTLKTLLYCSWRPWGERGREGGRREGGRKGEREREVFER